jgi:hypothetical protein
MDNMTMQDVQAVTLVLRQCSTYIPIELEHDVVIVDLTAINMNKLGRGLSNACIPKLTKAYRPDMRAVDFWLNSSQTKRKLQCKTTDRIKAFDRALDVFSVSGKPYKLNAKGRGDRRYLGFSVRVFGQSHTCYLHNLIGAEIYCRVHKNAWNSWAKSAFDADYLTWKGDNVFHHILPYQSCSLAGNTPLNLVLLDKWTHETTKVQYNQLRRRILDGDVDLNKSVILPKNTGLSTLQNVPAIGC